MNEKLYDFNFTVRENITLTAKWSVNKYNLKTIANGGYIGELNETEVVYEVEFNSDIPQITEPTRDGYEFAGWYTDSNFTTSFNITKMPASDVTIYAKWLEGNCVVSLIVDDVFAESFEVEVGKTIGNISYKPEKTGYTFVGWYYKDTNGDEKLVDANYVVNGSVSLYAKWSVNQYTISFETNGGSEVAPLTLDYNASLTEPLSPTKLGYEFKGWYTDSNLTNKLEKFPTNMPAENINLYAKWDICSYLLTIEFNNGNPSETHTVTYNSSLASYEPTAPTKADTVFIGWLYEGNLVDFQTLVMPAYDVTITAKFENEIIITFEGSETQTGVAGNTLNLPNDPVKEGYTFAGWYTDEDCTNEFDLKVFPTEDMHVFAKWEINKYDVTFIIGLDSKEVVISVEHNTKLSLAADLPDANLVGYTLTWLYDNEEVSLSDLIITSPITVTAKYDINKYNIQFIIDGKVSYELNDIIYNSPISFDGYVTKLNSDLALISEFYLLIQNVIATSGSASANSALQTFFTAKQEALLNVNDVVSSSVALYVSGGLDITGLFSIMEGQVSYLTGLTNAYELNKLSTGYAPFKNGYIFKGWALGEGAIYVDSTGKKYTAGDVIPNFAPAAINGNTVKLVASFKKLDTIDSVTVTDSDGKTTITWEAVDTSFINLANNKFSLSYEIYYYNGLELVLLDTVDTNSYTFKDYGKYKLVIYSKLTITNLSGAVIKTLISDAPKNAIEVDVEIEGLEDSFNESSNGDYYRNGTDKDGNSAFVFYTQNEYAFTTDSNNDGKPDFTFTITDSEGKPTSSSNATTEGHVIKISNVVGSFYFTNGVNKDTNGNLKVYRAYVVPFVTQFMFDKNLANYNDNKSNQSPFRNPSESIYTIGRYNANDVLAENDPKGINSIIYNEVLTYKNNGFSFDLAINTFGGNNIDYLSYGDYIKYQFYGLNSDNSINYDDPISNEEMGIYDEETGAWSFTAVEGLYGVVISISDKYLAPKQIKDELFPSLSFVFKLDNSINVYTHEQFKAVYANMSLGSTNVVDGNIVRGISMHSNIIAQISDNQRYLDANTKNPANNDYADPLNVGKDGSPINIHMDDIYEYSLNENFDSGNVYTRVSKEEIKEIYNINGNFFTINGQTLPSASINSIRNLSSINGYKIADVQISILLYLVGGDGADTGLGHLYVNDLQIIGNTSKPVFDSSNSSSSLDVMNRNSGGYIGVSVTNGNTLTLNNTIISNANLGVRANHGVMPNGTNPGTVVNINDTIVRSCWSNCVYGYYSPSFDIKNSLLKDAGGAAIYLADGDSKVGKPCGAYLQLDEKTVIDNYVAGTEGYFKANNMELVAMQLKAQINNKLDAKNNVVTDSITATLNTYFGDSISSYTILKEVIDETTHQSSEKFNLKLLFVTCGNNSDATMTE